VTAVDGSTGKKSTTTFKTLDGSAVARSVVQLDGYVNVHLSADELGTLVAQGDWQNDLTSVVAKYIHLEA
jgi:hypothetical protein